MAGENTRGKIEEALTAFKSETLLSAGLKLFDTLGYDTHLKQVLDEGTYSEFKELFVNSSLNVQSGKVVFSKDRARAAEWKRVELLFQLTDESLQEGGGCAAGTVDSDGDSGIKVDTQVIKSYLFFAIDLAGEEYSRSALAAITREVNKVFPMPVMLLFRYGSADRRRITIAANNRRVDRTDEERDVLLKVSLIKDIRIDNPHRAHLDILFDLCKGELQSKYHFADFVGLHNAWIAALDTRLLNKKFYGELVSWFFWALGTVRFPNYLDSKGQKAQNAVDKTDEAHNTESVIRFISRLLFVWFIKEKEFVAEDFFDAKWADANLNGFSSEGSGTVYYKAVLQNLFFAALNCPVQKRAFRKEGKRYSTDMGVDILMRYRALFKNEAAADIFLQAVNKQTPFMNGGLFECMDKTGKRAGHTQKTYIEGFSDREDNTLVFPDVMLFGEERTADLSAFYEEDAGNGAHKADKVRGIIPLLKQYKFTVAENTPLEEDVALDPELLGRVFENLLASVNSETRQTARKETGSFYTPREVVGYMADEVLRAVLAVTANGDGDGSGYAAVTVDSDGDGRRRYGSEGIQGFGDLAEGNADSRGCVCTSKETAARRDVCNERSDEEGGGINAVKHSRGTRAQFNEGVYSIPVNSKGVEVRAGNSTGAVCTGGDALSRRHNSNLGRALQGGKDDKCSYQETCIENNIRHSSLSPSLSPLAALFSDTAEPPALPLETRRALVRRISSLKILDPACGSGAFPMGVLLRLVTLLKKLDGDNTLWQEAQLEKVKAALDPVRDREGWEKAKAVIDDIFNQSKADTDYARKLYLIENCIYGVDIQTIAVQITKLRCFITLAIDQKKDESKDNFGIRALPNLEMRFIAANTLLPLQENMDKESKNNELVSGDIIDIRAKIKDNRHKLFSATSISRKDELRQRDKALREELCGALIATGTMPASEAQRVAKWDPFNKEESSDWFDAENMFGTAEFDAVLGNPPYIQLQKNGGQLANLYQGAHYKVFDRTGDIYCLFYERAMQLLKAGGAVCFITSNKWMRAGYGEKTRAFLAEQNPIALADFGGVKVFESATVDTAVLLVQKTSKKCRVKSAKNRMTACCKGEGILNTQHSSLNTVFMDLKAIGGGSWVVMSPVEQSIKRKVEAKGVPLKDWDIEINYGIKTGCNEAFIVDGEARRGILAQCKDSAELKRTEALIRPILRGRDIKRYKAEWAGLYLICTHNGVKDKGIKPIDIKDYPAVKAHLDKYWDKIKKRDDKGVTPYNLRNCAYWQDFDKPKVVYPNMTKYLPFYYDEKGYTTNQKCFIITGKHLAYLTAFLNSALFKYCFRDNFPELLGGTRELSKIFFDKTPVMQVTDAQDDGFKQLVHRAQDTPADSEAAAQIDEAVEALYGLTEEERAAVHSK